jgi:hypothetical protein
MRYDSAKPQVCVVQTFCTKSVQTFCTKSGQTLQSLPGTKEKSFSFYFKHYNFTIRVVNLFETFCTCSSSSLGQDLTV